MDHEFYFRRSHVPAFGSWDCEYDDDDDDHNYSQYTQCFESQAGLFRYSYSEDRDLYVAGDLYENHVVTPTVIVVPRRQGKEGYTMKEKEGKKDEWVVCDCESEMKVPKPAKAMDEDLYKISPALLSPHPKRKRAWGFFSSCLRPTQVC